MVSPATRAQTPDEVVHYETIAIGSDVRLVEWSPTDDLLAAISLGDNAVIIVDIGSMATPRTLDGGLEDPSQAAVATWSPNGKWIVSLNAHDDVQLWNVETGDQVASINIFDPDLGETRSSTASFSWSPDGRKVAVGDGIRMGIWDITTFEFTRVTSEIGVVLGIAWSPDGTQIAVIDDVSRINILDANTYEPISFWDNDMLPRVPLGLSFPITRHQYLRWSPDGSRIAHYYSRGEGVQVYAIFVRDASTGELVATLEGHQAPILAIAWAPDGKQLASSAGDYDPSNPLDRTVRIWDIDSYEQFYVLEGHTHIVSSVTWNPDGTQLASGSWDGTIRIWDMPQTE
jgi:WD40 repeat protein